MDGADEPGEQRINDVGGDRGQAGVSCGMGSGVELFESLDRDSGPGVLRMSFAGRDQLAQMVGVAAGVVAPEVLVGHQAVMDCDTTEPSEDTEVVHRLTTTLTVRQIRGQ